MIKVQNLRKVFRVHKKPPGLSASLKSLFRRDWIEKVAVEGADFTVEEGEIVGLIGANGAGKTTLVKMLSGIIHPSAGEARVLGYNPWEKHDAFRRQISLIMGQKAQLWWDLPGADCFQLLREIYQIPQQQFDHQLNRLTQLLNVGEELNIQIRRLSLGERMKMELIAALLHSPRVVYLDEPTIGLDITTQKAVRDFLLSYRKEESPAMILTSHYMEDIERLCERIIIIREGELIYDGSLRKVIEQYAPYKRLTLHLQNQTLDESSKEIFSKMGEKVQIQSDQVSIQVPRKNVTEVAAELLRKFKIHDLSIDEPEISDTIEILMGGKDLRQE
ncbi:MAG: ATP-binding cassette domain-containing protein [Planctomycetia bacterium]|jgi:ABC-2 type transport system ATP-binding protein|nr:ATP-binding cassette domain-containing protein [Planctomycetia bacterium]NCF99519.1 ATP-binding cassette domain-containing protein [Planctomycetia bacterium]NCG13256.1 ATP-binding cassette domain-containing protein [Planctomycetia bacterium]